VTVAKKLCSALIILNLMTVNLWACPIEQGGLMPDNDLEIPRNKSFFEDERDQIALDLINRVDRVFSTIVAEAGGNLKIALDVENPKVNAFAERDRQKNWHVNIMGGLIRHQLMTTDALAMVICHELGHHLAGAPRVSRFGPGKDDFASVEGQSDFYASMKCFRKIFAVDENEKIVKNLIINTQAKKACARKYGQDFKEYYLCQRIAAASYVLAKVLNSGREVSFVEKDPAVVATTYAKHPRAQCRLDTYFAGALCDNTLPPSNTNTKDGMCNRSEGDSIGVRPLCWFKPQAEFL